MKPKILKIEEDILHSREFDGAPKAYFVYLDNNKILWVENPFEDDISYRVGLLNSTNEQHLQACFFIDSHSIISVIEQFLSEVYEST